jgi:hypothetical protein
MTPTLAKIRALCLLAHRVQVEASQRLLQSDVLRSARRAGTDPRRRVRRHRRRGLCNSIHYFWHITAVHRVRQERTLARPWAVLEYCQRISTALECKLRECLH